MTQELPTTDSDLFNKVLDALRTKVSDFNFKNWFQHTSWHLEEPGRVLIKVPTKFIRDWLADHFLELIKFELFRVSEREYDVLFKVEKNVNRTLELFPQGAAPALPTTETPKVEDYSPVKAVNQFIRSQESRTTQRLATITQTVFNPKYTFANFVVGNGNQLVHAACKAVAAQPAKSYNPLFIYGGVGLGKTHLLNAVGIDVQKNYPHLRVLFVTGEKFTNEVIDAIRYDKTFELRRKYRESCDILLIDDIQFIAGKERTMEEFFHTFNALYEVRKQIILTSDRMPKDMAKLEERLKSRFGWGLLADIQAPDYETRMAILHKKAEEDGFDLAGDVCEFIASNVTANIRELEGALVRVYAFASLAGLQVTLDLTREVLKSVVGNVKPALSVEGIQNKVADYFQLRTSDLKSKRRHRALAYPRQIAMYLCKIHLPASFPEIGHKFGGKDHTTVMHAVQKIKKCLESDASLKTQIAELEKGLDFPRGHANAC